MPECELVNQMQSESRAIVILLDINDMQTLLRKVKYSTRPLSGEWRWPGMKKSMWIINNTRITIHACLSTDWRDLCSHFPQIGKSIFEFWLNATLNVGFGQPSFREVYTWILKAVMFTLILDCNTLLCYPTRSKNQNQLWLACMHFPMLPFSNIYLLEVLIG